MRWKLILVALLPHGLPFGASLRANAGAARDIGFDRNEYPGDASLAELHKTFAFAGYRLNVPPGADTNPWAGHRVAVARKASAFSCSSTVASKRS